jgi:hypothetical protein
MLPEICASAVPASAENPAAVPRIATIVPSLDVYIGCPSVDVVPLMTLGMAAIFRVRDGSRWPAEPGDDGDWRRMRKRHASKT